MKGNSLSAVIAFATVSMSLTGCTLSDEDIKQSQNAAELNAATLASAFVLTVTTETAPQDKVVVTSSDGTPPRDCFGGCQFAYLAGASLSLRVPFPTDKVNCIAFGGWSGACAGQGTTCNLVLNSDLTAEVLWVPIHGCNPR